MRYIIASDIHGSASCCRSLLDAFDRENGERLLLLGDVLYHGPRNDLPDGYSPKEVIAMLNLFTESVPVIAVRGNCDAEVDRAVLSFPLGSDFAVVCDGGVTVFATHGHVYGADNPPPLKKGNILLQGHTHIACREDRGGFLLFNPGSVSIPRGGTPAGYMVMDNGLFEWKTLSGERYDSFSPF